MPAEDETLCEGYRYTRATPPVQADYLGAWMDTLGIARTARVSTEQPLD